MFQIRAVRPTFADVNSHRSRVGRKRRCPQSLRWNVHGPGGGDFRGRHLGVGRQQVAGGLSDPSLSVGVTNEQALGVSEQLKLFSGEAGS